MSDFEAIASRTIAAYVEEPNGSGHGYIIDADDFDTLLDAARRFASLTSPETKQRAVIRLQQEFGHDLHPNQSKIVEAVLRSVEEGKT